MLQLRRSLFQTRYIFSVEKEMWALNIARRWSTGAKGCAEGANTAALAHQGARILCSQPTSLWWCEMRKNRLLVHSFWEESSLAGGRERGRVRAEAVSTPYRSGAGTQPHRGLLRNSLSHPSMPQELLFCICIIANPQLTSTPLILTNSRVVSFQFGIRFLNKHHKSSYFL